MLYCCEYNTIQYSNTTFVPQRGSIYLLAELLTTFAQWNTLVSQ